MEKHAFLSYVREDTAAADRVQAALQSIGVTVWRDTTDLGPGEIWKKRIREAIQGQALAFVALVSRQSVTKERSFQRPELLWAAEEYQLHPPEREWLFIARVDDCDLPYLDLGGGRTLSDLQWSDLYGSKGEQGLLRLSMAVHRLLQPPLAPRAVEDVVVARPSADGSQAGISLRKLLRDPNGDIELDDQIDELALQAVEALADRDRFPLTPTAFSTSAEGVQLAGRMIQDFEEVLAQLAEAFVLAGTWARPTNDRSWTRAMERIIQVCLHPETTGPVSTLLQGLRQYPLLWLGYAVTIPGFARENFSPARAVLIDAQAEQHDQTGPLMTVLNPQYVFNPEWTGTAVVAALEGNRTIDDAFVREVELGRIGRRHTPATDLLHDRLRPYFRREFSSDSRYTDAFDRASVLMDALALDLRSQSTPSRYLPARPGFGSYTWRYQHTGQPIETVLSGEFQAGSPLLKAGFFDRDATRGGAAFSALVDHVERVRSQRF